MNTRHFKLALLAAGAASAALVAAPASAQTADQAARIAALEAQLSEISQALIDLKTSTAATTDDLSKRLNATTVALPSGKPALATVDGVFTANIRGVIQLDAAQYLQDKPQPLAVTTGTDLNSGTNFRRFRFGVDGKLFRDFDYSILTDFGGSGTDGPGAIQEAYVQYNGLLVPGVTVAGAPSALRIRAGAFAPNLGLEDAASTSAAIFPERATPAELARSLAGADKRIALQVGLNSDRWLVSGAVTGAKAGDAATFDEQVGYLARIAGTPLKSPGFLVHVGVNGSVVAQPAQASVGGPYNITLTDRPELRVDTAQLISTNNGATAIDAKGANHVGAELAIQKNNFLLQGEYYQYAIKRRIPTAGQTNPKFDGWYAEASYIFGVTAPRKYNIVTGAFDAPTIAKNFSRRDGGAGAWEVAVRYSYANLNDEIFSTTASNRVRGGEQKILSGQLNWFLNPAIKLGLTYYDVRVDRLNNAGVQAGQSYQAVNFRTSLAF